MSYLSNQTRQKFSDALEAFFSDEESLKILANAQKASEQGHKLSTEDPELLRQQALALSVEPFTGNGPHHGINAQEVFNTALRRKFANLICDSIPLEVIQATEKNELANLLEACHASNELADLGQNHHQAPLQTKATANLDLMVACTPRSTQEEITLHNAPAKPKQPKQQEQSATTPPLQASTHPLQLEEELSQPTIRSESTLSTTQEPSEQRDTVQSLPLSPSLILLSDELSYSQKYLFSTVFDFLILHHRLPQLTSNAQEAQTAMLLKSLYKEIPQACTTLLKFFLGVFSAADVELVQNTYLKPTSSKEPLVLTPVTGTTTALGHAPREFNEQNEQKMQEASQGVTVMQEAQEKNVPLDSPKVKTTVKAKIQASSTYTQKPRFNPESKLETELESIPDAAPEPLPKIKREIGKVANAEIQDFDMYDDTADEANGLEQADEYHEVKAPALAKQSSTHPYLKANLHEGRGPIKPTSDSTSLRESTDSTWQTILAEGEELGILTEDNNDVVLFPKNYKSNRSLPLTYLSSSHASSLDGLVADYTACPNFSQYNWIFQEVMTSLQQVDCKMVCCTGKENSRSIDLGDCFMLNNVFYLVANVNLDNALSLRKPQFGQHRILLITDTGKETRPLNTSLLAKFYKSAAAYRIVACNNNGIDLLKRIKLYCIKLNQHRQIPGYIYVLRSLSTNPILVEYMQHSELLKIGYSTQNVAERIANAAHETTYLEAPVEVLLTVECTDCDPHIFEQIIHRVLAKRRLNITLKSTTGKTYRPKEWFTVSLEVARDVISHVLDGTISNFHLNPVNGRLTPNSYD